MIGLAVLVATLVCQTPAPLPPAPPRAPGTGILGFKTPAPTNGSPPPLTGGDYLRSQAQKDAPTTAPAAPATPSVADLFRERNAREAAAKAAEAGATSSATVPDGTYRCRRSDNGLVCGTSEGAMRRTEAANKAMLDRLTAPN